MREVSLGSPAGVLLVVVVLAAAAWPFVGDRIDTATVGDAPGCAGSGDLPSATGARSARAVLVCLHNAERAKHGLPALRSEPRLARAAQAHAEDMVGRRFFEHENPDGRGPADRIRGAGYPREAAVGENLAWGEEAEATPVRIVEGWMKSPGHRRNLLRRQWTQMGIGIAAGGPEASARQRAFTFVAAFGSG